MGAGADAKALILPEKAGSQGLGLLTVRPVANNKYEMSLTVQ